MKDTQYEQIYHEIRKIRKALEKMVKDDDPKTVKFDLAE